LIAFFIYCLGGLYKLHQNNTFLYRVTQVVPFPIAKIGDSYVSYENYLFELRHYIHYYQNQQQKDFSGSDKEQLIQFRRVALDDVVNDAYVKRLAHQNQVKVTNKEIDDRLGSNKVFADVLKNYWGWSVTDFKKSLSRQILREKVVAKMDVEDHAKAEATLTQLKNGADFATLAKAVSDDTTTKGNGGNFGFPIAKSNPNIPPQVTSALFKLKPGQISDIITTGSTLEILKVSQNDGNNVTASHISINLKDISTFINQIKVKEPPKKYISI
jgi:parvulin-like peptidyl-prolyl isomerase